MGEVTFGKKVGISLMLLVFGFLVLVISSGTGDFDREMRRFATDGVRLSVPRVSKKLKHDGMNRPYSESTYVYKVAGKSYRHVEYSYAQWDDNPPRDIEELTYLPEAPGEAKMGVSGWERTAKLTPIIAGGFIFLGLGALIVTITRRGVHDRAVSADVASISVSTVGLESREFNYRRPLNLAFGLVMIPICVLLPTAFARAAAGGEITVNNHVGSPAEQWGVFAISLVVCGVFFALSVVMLLSYVNERIVWDGGTIAWYDRMRRLKVKSPISGIVEVGESSSMFRGNQGSISKITITTTDGDITFLETAPWAPILKSWAQKAAQMNRTNRPHF